MLKTFLNLQGDDSGSEFSVDTAAEGELREVARSVGARCDANFGNFRILQIYLANFYPFSNFEQIFNDKERWFVRKSNCDRVHLFLFNNGAVILKKCYF